MTFGAPGYSIKAFAGTQNASRFCTIEKKRKQTTHRVCMYTSRGDCLLENSLEGPASHLEVNRSFDRAIVYSYMGSSVRVMNLLSGSIVYERIITEPEFFGFVEDAPLIQDSSGAVWRLEIGGDKTSVEHSLPIVAWSHDGNLRVVQRDEDALLIQGRRGENLRLIPRLGLKCYDPTVSISETSQEVLLFEVGGALRLFSAIPGGREMWRYMPKNGSLAFASFTHRPSEAISLAHDEDSTRRSTFFRMTPEKVKIIHSIGASPVLGHFLNEGTVFASGTGELIDLPGL